MLEPSAGIEPQKYKLRLTSGQAGYYIMIEPTVGIEPTTCALRVRCSTN